MLGRPLLLTALLFVSALARAKDGDLATVPSVDRPACEKNLMVLDFLHNRMGSEPLNPQDPIGFVTDAFPLTVETMVRAYAKGLFAAEESEARPGHVELITPLERGVMELDPNDLDRGISRRDLRTIRQMRARGYKVRFDTNFAGVVAGCSQQRHVKTTDPRAWRQEKTGQPKENPNWISDRFRRVFLEMHLLNYAHSVEVYFNNELVAGLFGTFVDGVFTGESMFYVPGVGNNANKLAIYELRRRLALKGHLMIDTEQTKGLILDMGGVSLPRDEFKALRARQAALDLPF